MKKKSRIIKIGRKKNNEKSQEKYIIKTQRKLVANSTIVRAKRFRELGNDAKRARQEAS